MSQAKLVKISDLRLADVIECFPTGPFNTGTVSRITDTEVEIHRPYGVSGDHWSVKQPDGGSVSCYVGTEVYSIPRDRDTMLPVWSRKDLK